MKNQKRGKNIAIAGLVIQSAITVVAAVVWRMSGSHAALSAIWLLLGGVPLWLFTAVFFYARQLQRIEEIEIRELADSAAADGMFGGEDAGQMTPARKRVAFMRSWLMPGLSVVMAGYHVTMAALVIHQLKERENGGELSGVAAAAAFLSICMFASFLLSRYATGLSRGADWLPLRAVGGYLLLSSTAMAALILGLVFDSVEGFAPDLILAWVFPAVQALLGLELVINFILELYRPRVGKDEPAPCYESRLLNLAAEPSRIGHSIADTLNYQFGFEVSSTWFYRLLSKVMMPLLGGGVILMFALSGVVTVRPGRRGVLKRWGRLVNGSTVLEPGLHFKWPWPVDTVEKYRMNTVHETIIGMGGGQKVSRGRDGRVVNMWSVEHGYRGQKELDFLIGAPPGGGEEGRRNDADESGAAGASTDVQIIKLVISMQYRVRDVLAFNYTVDKPHDLVELTARQEMIRYCASATLTERLSAAGDRPQAIMSTGRQDAAGELQRRVQKRLDELRLGAEVVYVGIISAHPPTEVVPAFEDVLAAEREQDIERYRAEGEAASILAGTAGDLKTAYLLQLAVERRDILRDLMKAGPGSAAFSRILAGFRARVDSSIADLRQRLRRDMQLAGHERRRGEIDALCASLREAARGQDAERVQDITARLGRELRTETILGYRGYARQRIEALAAALKGNTHAAALGRIRDSLRSAALPVSIDEGDYTVSLLARYVELRDELAAAAVSPKTVAFAEKIAAAGAEIEKRLDLAQGEAARLLAEARAANWTLRLRGEADIVTARRAVLPYRACPAVYRFDRYADVLDEHLPDIQKYVLGVDPEDIEIRLNLQKEGEILSGFGGG